jgi:hypothetical protein
VQAFWASAAELKNRSLVEVACAKEVVGTDAAMSTVHASCSATLALTDPGAMQLIARPQTCLTQFNKDTTRLPNI